MNLILLTPKALAAGQTATIQGPPARHIRDHLKKQVGDTIRVGVVNGPQGTATIDSLDDTKVTATCTWTTDRSARPSIDLILALPRPKVMKRLWAQLAALGLGHIYICNAWKVEKYYFDSHVIDPTTYEPLLIEGLQQAGDTYLPTVSIHRGFKPLIEDSLPESQRWVAHPGKTCRTGTEVSPIPASRHLLAIGPEGGWTGYELERLQEQNFSPLCLGPRTLRTDTACIAAITLLCSQIENAVT